MKRFILNLSTCLVIAFCSISLMGCFGKTETPVETPTVEEPTTTEEPAAPVEEGTETATEEGATTGEKG